MEKLYPIVPVTGDKYISDFCRYITEETDLIEYYRPGYEEGYMASLDAIELLEKVFNKPSRYFHTFSKVNILEKWKEKENQNYTLFSEKYTYEFERFCLENKVAYQCSEGMLVPHELAFLYMSFLSHIISDKNNISAITDQAPLERISLLSRNYNNKSQDKIKIIRNSIGLYLPEKIENVDIQDIIKLRNSNDFKQTLKSFHNELDSYLLSIEGEGDPRDFIDSLKYSMSNLKCELVKMSPQVFMLIVGIWTTLGTKNIDNIQIAGQALTGLSIGATAMQISNEWNNSHSKRFAKKYLASMRRLQHKQANRKRQILTVSN